MSQSKETARTAVIMKPEPSKVGKIPTAKEAIEGLQAMYSKKDDGLEPNKKRMQLLIYGDTGSGKTHSLLTARFPLFIDSFDPNGSLAIEHLVEEGKALIVNEYENEDPLNPTAFKNWTVNFERYLKAGVFDHIGTYVMDSATTWGNAIMNHVLLLSHRAGGVPHQNDYQPQMNAMEQAIKRMLALPCDVVLICHPKVVKDEVTGGLMREPLLTGKSVQRIQLLFSEVYYADTVRTPNGTNYVWHIAKSSSTSARSRLAGKPGVKLDTTIPQDFKQLYKKAGVSTEDLPLLTTL